MTATSVVSSSGNSTVDGILSASKWASGDLTFSFPTEASTYGGTYGSGEPFANFQPLSAAAQDAVRGILESYSDFSNLTFTEIVETATQHATIRLAQSDGTEVAHAYYPNAAQEGGDAWFNAAGDLFDEAPRASYAQFAFVHEIGHALGLKHSFESTGFGAVPPAFDSMEHTVMSYSSYAGATGYLATDGNYPTAAMTLDIAAIQHLYGANFATRGGDTVYRWSAETGERFVDGVGQGASTSGHVLETIWDGGGSDTYDLSNQSGDVQVDLAPGAWTTFSQAALAQLHFDGSHPAAGSVANALLYQGDLRSLIENAVGGAGDDTLFGNQADNQLSGGQGDDLIAGRTGNDSLIGNSGSDTMIGGAGNDTFWGGSGADSLQGGAGNDSFYGGVDGDQIDGGEGTDALWGQAGDDVLSGGSGNDALDGGEGNDKLSGGGGDDRLFGGAGDDVYIVSSGSTGIDKIADFGDAAGNEDVVDLSQVFGAVAEAVFESWSSDHLVQKGANVLVSLGSDSQIWLLGVSTSDLGYDDFRFAA